ncbi:hypothetical protein L249_5653 [Ophiocordyceps polyrhachis-furcata BCC 54312]|uniref:Uncharacterized protein n=1 Tax=Ophiocordyceps polyrhachis-furcata BCC 54312 TaxID=1330021 RepID=A0A367LGE5_9HYPO|nr:hypothetical protein L249_5653 [Ophiocordyceps polyrhachis-furcata BCC 54312]
MCIIWVSGPSSSCSLIRANASSDLFTTIEVGRYDRYWYSAYSAPIAVTIAVTSRFGRYDRYSPTVTQGVVAGLRPNWYNLFQVALQAYFLSVQDEKICVI